MLPQDLLLTAGESLRAHKLRTFLSVLGIVIGIASFSLMYSIGETARLKTLASIKRLGGDIFRVTPKEHEKSRKDPSQNFSFTSQDVSSIQQTCANILDVSPELNASISYFKDGMLVSRNIIAVMPAYFRMNKIKPSRGRLFSKLDTDYGLQVCLVGPETAAELFPGEDPLAQKIRINDYLFQVIGVLKVEEQFGFSRLKDCILIPLPIAERLFPDKEISVLHMRGKNTRAALAEIRQFLFRQFGNILFDIQSQKMLLEAQQQSFKIFEYVLWAIGAISLVVGGIGIMNIMLVSVTERVREIGIRRAVGATRLDIMMQFLCEAILLCVLGGLGGTLLGFAGSRLIARSFSFLPVFSFKLLFIAIAVATVLGMVCGTYPAIRAANQDPTVVLRYE